MKTYGEVIDAHIASQTPATMQTLAERLTAQSGRTHRVYRNGTSLVVYAEHYAEALGLAAA